MKKMKFLLTAMCAALMLFGVITTASADTIYITPATTPQWTGSETGMPFIIDEIEAQIPGFKNLAETYVLTTPEEASGATLQGLNLPGSLYLLVKDGSIGNPAWYLFDLQNLNGASWNGTDTLELSDFWPGQGAISNVRIYGNPVPIPAAVWLLGSGLLGLVGIRRRFKK